ncbi:hypothetical protein B0T21DRAFT_350974 [Apiosordaria backusii]|uniref:Uncharacterized protein n=1 Tax=Apiosordaria backusii TaxID=314023 RepID=A0AA40AXK1_9PEZI|nr:hypothetical protein B0T21DRAFT_350974 [Apiosordaria backusii]
MVTAVTVTFAWILLLPLSPLWAIYYYCCRQRWRQKKEERREKKRVENIRERNRRAYQSNERLRELHRERQRETGMIGYDIERADLEADPSAAETTPEVHVPDPVAKRDNEVLYVRKYGIPLGTIVEGN